MQDDGTEVLQSTLAVACVHQYGRPSEIIQTELLWVQVQSDTYSAVIGAHNHSPKPIYDISSCTIIVTKGSSRIASIGWVWFQFYNTFMGWERVIR